MRSAAAPSTGASVALALVMKLRVRQFSELIKLYGLDNNRPASLSSYDQSRARVQVRDRQPGAPAIGTADNTAVVIW
jgi:hypothetical protein